MTMKQETNYYKYATYVLVAIAIIFIIGYFLNSSMDKKFNEGVIEGQKNAVSFVLSEIVNEGAVTITIDSNNSVTLVPVQAINRAQQQIFADMFGFLVQDGYVTIRSGNNTVTLVPYTGPTQ